MKTMKDKLIVVKKVDSAATIPLGALLGEVEKVGGLIMQNLEASPEKALSDWMMTCTADSLRDTLEVCKSFKTSHTESTRTALNVLWF